MNRREKEEGDPAFFLLSEVRRATCSGGWVQYGTWMGAHFAASAADSNDIVSDAYFFWVAPVAKKSQLKRKRKGGGGGGTYFHLPLASTQRRRVLPGLKGEGGGGGRSPCGFLLAHIS